MTVVNYIRLHLVTCCTQSGFSDGNAYIRELTLKSVMSLAPKLSNKTLVGNVLKHLSRLQVCVKRFKLVEEGHGRQAGR